MDKTPIQLKDTIRHRKPPKRLTDYKKAVKLEKGLKLAEQDAELKKYDGKKGIKLFLQRMIEKLSDKIDPIDTIAIIGMTVIVKQTIDGSEELLGKMRTAVWTPPSVATSGLEWWEYVPIAGELWAKHIGKTSGSKERETYVSEAPKGAMELFPDWQEWLISFCIAYMFVKHGGAIFNMIGDIGGGLVKAIGLFLA